MRNLTLVVAIAAVAVAAGGCGEFARRGIETVQPEPVPPSQADHLANTAVNYNDGGGAGAESTVDRALMWSEKYGEAVDRLSKLQQAYRDLEQENRAVQATIAQAKTELAQSEKELTDANSLLVEMRTELDRWKRSVLGYREEMRQAQQAQLEALGKVIMLLGGAEVIAPTAQPAGTDAAEASGHGGSGPEKRGA